MPIYDIVQRYMYSRHVYCNSVYILYIKKDTDDQKLVNNKQYSKNYKKVTKKSNK